MRVGVDLLGEAEAPRERAVAPLEAVEGLRAAPGVGPALAPDEELVALGLDDDVLAAETRELDLHDVRLLGVDHVGERHPRALEQGGLVEPLAGEGLVEQAVHALLQVEQLLERVAAQGHGRF